MFLECLINNQYVIKLSQVGFNDTIDESKEKNNTDI